MATIQCTYSLYRTCTLLQPSQGVEKNDTYLMHVYIYVVVVSTEEALVGAEYSFVNARVGSKLSMLLSDCLRAVPFPICSASQGAP